MPGTHVLAHGIWIDDLAVPLVVAAAFALGVIRASSGAPGDDGRCPYCDAPATDRRLVGGRGDELAERCGRCGFRLGARLAPEAELAAVEEESP